MKPTLLSKEMMLLLRFSNVLREGWNQLTKKCFSVADSGFYNANIKFAMFRDNCLFFKTRYKQTLPSFVLMFNNWKDLRIDQFSADTSVTARIVKTLPLVLSEEH